VASPQTENGYTKIANELLEAICRARFKGAECSVVLWIARMSYGWSARKTRTIGVREMAEDMKSPYTSIRLALRVLIEKGVIERDEKGRYSINKDYESWVEGGQPVDQKVVSPLTRVVSPLTRVVSPLTNNGQPVDHFHDEPKERKKDKEICKGTADTNTDFPIPSLADVVAYALEINKAMDCRRFHDHYTANGWLRGGNPIKDWTACARMWQDDTPHENQAPAIPRCRRCRRDGYHESVLGRDGKSKICSTCRMEEDVAAGVV
jgi:phage replication O-like protein O